MSAKVNPDRIPFCEIQMKQTLLLMKLAEEEGDYEKRNGLTYCLLSQAALLGYPHGVRFDPETPEWPVLYVELPTGQISFHVPQHQAEWDGHPTEEKWKRINQYLFSPADLTRGEPQ